MSSARRGLSCRVAREMGFVDDYALIDFSTFSKWRRLGRVLTIDRLFPANSFME
jgi:hypothetical protein